MHEPGVTQLPFAVAAAAVSIGVGVYGAVQQGKAGKQAAKSYEFNAKQIEMDTADELRQQRRQAYKIYGAAQAGAGANGLAASGSVLDVLAESARNAQEDASVISRRGAGNAQIARMGGQAAQSAGNAALISGVIGGVANGVSAYSNYSAPRSSSNTLTASQTSQIMNVGMR